IVVAVLGFVLLRYTSIIQTSHVPSLAVLSLLSSFIQIHQTILLAKKKISNANLVTIVSLLLQVAGILFCFYFAGISDAYAYIYSSLGAYVVTTVFSFFLVKHWIHFSAFTKNFSITELKQSFRYGLLYQLVEILQLFNLRYYFYQLGLQQGVQYLGVFSIGISILEAVWIIPRSMATVHYVSTSNSAEVKRHAGNTVKLVQLSVLLSAVALLAVYVLPTAVYVSVFGPGFTDVKHSMRFLFPGILVYSIPLVISSFYFGIGRYAPLIVAHIAGIVALLAFSYYLIPKYVMSGAGLAASISFTVAAVTLLCWFVYEQKVKPADLFRLQYDLKKISLF
ncbi:MAG TPA: polysaccharide biosynthesis C-terminal domain-containing protein, partial [Chitinophagales bacterium]|nr:polysaccharide biosynthesis C-terminal domain-containing protein [Chitinophagales bacterium]